MNRDDRKRGIAETHRSAPSPLVMLPCFFFPSRALHLPHPVHPHQLGVMRPVVSHLSLKAFLIARPMRCASFTFVVEMTMLPCPFSLTAITRSRGF